jgi:hypothetical protein
MILILSLSKDEVAAMNRRPKNEPPELRRQQ